MDEYDDSKLRRQLADLREQLSALQLQVRGLPERWELRELQRQLREGVEAVRQELDEHADELQSDLDGRVRALRREHEMARASLERRLRWIERHLRSTAGVVAVDLDPTLDVVELAKRADRGKTCSAQLLTAASRALKGSAIEAWETWQTEQRAHTARAVMASRTISGTGPGLPDRTVAEADYRAARDSLADLADSHDSAHRAYTAAIQQLARDDEFSRTHQDDIADGKDAWGKLTGCLRVRLVEAVERGELFPAWFDAVLGMIPPADADEWRRAGVELLAYRATYAIDDPLVALGPDPEPGFSVRRRAWHQRLTTMFRDYHW